MLWLFETNSFGRQSQHCIWGERGEGEGGGECSNILGNVVFSVLARKKGFSKGRTAFFSREVPMCRKQQKISTGHGK